MNDDVTRELHLDLPVDAAWAAITDPALLREWLADEVSLELVPGGSATFVVDGEPRSGWVEEVRPPHDVHPPHEGHPPHDDATGRFVFWWQADGEPASRVELEVSALEESRSVVRVSETRPLELLDLVGRALPGVGGTASGPLLVAAGR